MPRRADCVLRRCGVALALPALLLACGPGSRAPVGHLGEPAGACRSGPEGEPVAGPREVERGIGETGVETGQSLVERGIGGTGIVGSTGIIGTIDGFGSVCADGVEIALQPGARIEMDGTPSSLSALRAGQVVAITANGPEAALSASLVVVRHEVSGPITRIGADGRSLVVASQPVVVADTAWVLGAKGPDSRTRLAGLLPGDWVAVSGLRQVDGSIVASRIDRRAPGPVVVRGALSKADGTLWIGPLQVGGGAGRAAPGAPAAVQGHYEGAVLVADTLAADFDPAAPAASFGPLVDHLLVESFLKVADDRVIFADGETVPRVALAPGPPGSGERIAELRRGADGVFRVAGLRPPPQGGLRDPRRPDALPSPGVPGPGVPGPGVPGPGVPGPDSSGPNSSGPGASGPGSDGPGSAPPGSSSGRSPPPPSGPGPEPPVH